MKITIIGLGCVAVADALALARNHEVVLTGPVPDRVEAINSGQYGLRDPLLADYLAENTLNLRAMLDTSEALAGADMVLVSTPLTRDPVTGCPDLVELDTRVEFVARNLPAAPIVVRSAVPVGYCESRRIELKGAKIVYAPEFCHEGQMLSDILYPEFLIVGDRYALGQRVLGMLKSAAVRTDMPIHQMDLTEAERIRQFSGLYHSVPLGAGRGAEKDERQQRDEMEQSAAPQSFPATDPEHERSAVSTGVVAMPQSGSAMHIEMLAPITTSQAAYSPCF